MGSAASETAERRDARRGGEDARRAEVGVRGGWDRMNCSWGNVQSEAE